MGLNRNSKQALIEELKVLIARTQTLVLAAYRGLTVTDMTKLRVLAREKGVKLSVLKNTLARRAVSGSPFEKIAEKMTGPLLYGFSEDPVSAAKVLVDFSKTNEKLVVHAGAYEGQALTAAQVRELASIPSKEVLLAQLLGLLQSPVLATARVLSAVAEKKSA